MKGLSRPVFALLGMVTLVAGLLYPLAVTGIAHVFFPWRASGSLLEKNGRIVGSELIGQQFAGRRYFRGRPSATIPVPYNAEASSGSNLGPTNPIFLKMAGERAAELLKNNPSAAGPIPVDLLTSSGSGLDPDISPEAAAWQAGGVAAERGLDKARIEALIKENTSGRFLGILGEPRVNVLKLNMALDSER